MTELITLPRTTVQQALEALELAYAGTPAITVHGKAITALKAALEQPKTPDLCWAEAPERTQWGAGMMEGLVALGKDHTLRLYAEREALPLVVPSLRAALEQPEQEPVAWMTPGQDLHLNNSERFRFSDWTPLYTHPPRREWRGLTEEETQSVIQLEREKRFQRRPPLPLSMTELSHAIEAKLKELNHG